jgi:hypothetical protein
MCADSHFITGDIITKSEEPQSIKRVDTKATLAEAIYPLILAPKAGDSSDWLFHSGVDLS